MMDGEYTNIKREGDNHQQESIMEQSHHYDGWSWGIPTSDNHNTQMMHSNQQLLSWPSSSRPDSRHGKSKNVRFTKQQPIA